MPHTVLKLYNNYIITARMGKVMFSVCSHSTKVGTPKDSLHGGGMPLAFTQEDFLVCFVTIENVSIQCEYHRKYQTRGHRQRTE